MSEYKLVAIDIDGTLLDDKGNITEENKIAITKAIENGVKVCLCTGRNIKNTKGIAKKLGSDLPFVCADGTVFYDVKQNKVIEEYFLSENTFNSIIEKADKLNVCMELCTKKHYIKYVKNKELENYTYGEMPNTIMERIENHFIKSVRYLKTYDKFKSCYHNKVNQLIISGDKEELGKMKEFLEKSDFGDIDIRADLWANYIFIVPKDCNKAFGLNILSKYFDISIDEMIAIGDQMNDIDMIKKAGLGVAMGNATEGIKEASKFITKSNNESGVAFAIEKFILNI